VRTTLALALALVCLPQSLRPAPPVLFEGQRLIADARRPPVENAAMLVENGRVAKVGRKGEIRPPAGALRVDLTGKTVIPALIDAHIHIGYQNGLSYSASNFTRANLVDQLNRYAYAGVAAVMSLGTDIGDLAFQLRAEQESGALGGALIRTAGRGFAAPNAGPGIEALRPSAIGVTTESEARKLVREQIAKKVDAVKIWVDDRNGTVQKLSPSLYRAIIDEAHKHGTRVVAHVFYLEDARDLVRAGIDGFAHLVRDREMDGELIAQIKQRNVFVMPNLAISNNATYAEAPAWLDDPLLHATSAAALIDRVRGSFRQRSPEAVERARNTYRTMQRSLARLSAAGVRIGFGTDDGVGDHFLAFTPHRELGLMVEAGMTPAQALAAATVVSAEFLRLPRHGTLDAGRSADFVVLEANPLDDIAHTRKIARVYLRGEEIARDALRASWK
jgi:imidazolonepropionase-like amidohydrolase